MSESLNIVAQVSLNVCCLQLAVSLSFEFIEHLQHHAAAETISPSLN